MKYDWSFKMYPISCRTVLSLIWHIINRHWGFSRIAVRSEVFFGIKIKLIGCGDCFLRRFYDQEYKTGNCLPTIEDASDMDIRAEVLECSNGGYYQIDFHSNGIYLGYITATKKDTATEIARRINRRD